MASKLHFEAIYPFSIDRVWVALTDPDAMSDWLMPNDFKPVVGHRFNFRTKPAPGFDGVVHCEVLEIDPPRHLAFSWKGGGIDTVVRFTLSGHGDGTRMVMEQEGFKGIRGFMVSRLLGGGWKRMIHERLPRATEQVREGSYRPDLDADSRGA